MSYSGSHMARAKSRKPRARKKVRDERDELEMQILETVACPGNTAEHAYGVCMSMLAEAVPAFIFLNTADHVWRNEPQQQILHEAMMSLRSQLLSHVEQVERIANMLQPLAEAVEDHDDLTPEEVFARLKPMFAEQEKRRSEEN